MAPEIPTTSDPPADSIKHVPQETATRQAIRSAAAQLVTGMDRSRPPSREDLEQSGESVLRQLGLARQFLGFAMVAVSNEFWRPTLAAIPPLAASSFCPTASPIGPPAWESTMRSACTAAAVEAAKSTALKTRGRATGLCGDRGRRDRLGGHEDPGRRSRRDPGRGLPRLAGKVLPPRRRAGSAPHGAAAAQGRLRRYRRPRWIRFARCWPPTRRARRRRPAAIFPCLRETARMFQQPAFSQLLGPLRRIGRTCRQPGRRLGFGRRHCPGLAEGRRQTAAPLRDGCRLCRRPPRHGRVWTAANRRAR